MEHRGVSNDHHLVDAVAVHTRALVQLGKDRVDRPPDGIAELRLRLIALHAVTDPGDDVRAKRRLAVQRRAHRLRHPGLQVHEGAHHGCRAQVDGDAVTLLTRVAWFNRNQCIATENGRYREAGVTQHDRQTTQYAQIGLHIEAFGGQGIAQPLEVTALILETGLAQLDKDFSHVGIEQDQPVNAHGCGLRDPEQFRHGDRRVLVDLRLAGEAPAGLQLDRA